MAIVRSQEASSSSTFGYNYQVFLSFRGEDTRKTFTDHLYTALDQAGLRTFIDDDDIERGKRLEFELCKAIQESRISIIVFSKNYASSKWCLDEVVMILKWSRSSSSSGHEVLPVFYDVDPSDGTQTIEGLILDMEMYKDNAHNVRKGKKRLYDEFCGTSLSSSQGSLFRRGYFNFLSSEPSLNVDFNYGAFSRMERLKLLKLNYAKLSGCCEMFPEDDDFPLDFSNLSTLKILDLSHNHFLNLPQCVGSLPKLSRLYLNLCKELHSILGLPNVNYLEVTGCRSLESVAYQSTLTRPIIRPSACGNLKEVQGMFKLEPIEKVNREIFDDLGLYGVELIGNLKFSCAIPIHFKIEENIQGLYEFGIFSTFLRREKIPSWCGNRNDNKVSPSSISFVVPSHPTSLRIRGLNVYSVYKLSNFDKIEHRFLLFTKINNKSKDLKWIYSPITIAIPEKGKEEEEFVWLSNWKLGNHLEKGDEVDVSVICTEDLEVEEFGINFVWGEEEEEEIKASPLRNNTRDVTGGDLSNYQFMSPRVFFLTHYDWIYFYQSTSKSWFQELFGDHDVTWEGMCAL
ncbi:hypothetical protein LguiB_006564 [Lonicera macranthoides]